MTVDKAINASDVGMAERVNPRDPRHGFIYARRIADTIGGIRIVSSYTDPTVVRKPRWNELLSEDWFPCKEEADGESEATA
jgi:hypothetical protein